MLFNGSRDITRTDVKRYPHDESASVGRESTTETYKFLSMKEVTNFLFLKSGFDVEGLKV